MGLFDSLFGNKTSGSYSERGVVDYGKNKSGGGHDHRVNRGDDRTPAQKEGDKKRRKD